MNIVISREEHLKKCKERALLCVNEGKLDAAFTSMISDLSKHPDTNDIGVVTMSTHMFINGFLKTPAQVTEWINGIK